MSVTLHYFAIRGFGEYIRLLLTDQGVQFNDHRFDRYSQEWEDLKKTMTFSQVPFLEIDGKRLVQTGAIMRYLGRRLNLNGDNEDETTFIDTFFEGVRDVRNKYVRFVYYDDETHENFIHVTLPSYLTNLQNLLQTYENGEKFILGDKISYADYLLFEELDVYQTSDRTALDKFPILKSYHERMWNRPNLKGYLEKRRSENVQINAIPKQ